MKTKKLLRTSVSLLGAAAAVSMLGTAAGAQVIDFEDGVYDPYFQMKTNDGGDLSVLSVVDFNGSKQLKVDVQDCSMLPKVQIYLDKLVGSDHLSDIAKVQLELTIASKDGTTPPGWIGGDLGSESLDGQVTLAWTDTGYEGGEYENPVAQTILVEHKWLLPAKAPQNGMTDITCLLQRWGCDVPYDMYIDNVKLLDKDGNVLDVMDQAGSAPAETEAPAPAETEAAPAETEAAPAETEAPAPDSSTQSTTTGNATAGSMAAVMALAAAAAFAAKKKTK